MKQPEFIYVLISLFILTALFVAFAAIALLPSVIAPSEILRADGVRGIHLAAPGFFKHSMWMG